MAHNSQVDDVQYALAQSLINSGTVGNISTAEELDEKQKLRIAEGSEISSDALKSFDSDTQKGDVHEVGKHLVAPTSHEFETLRRISGKIPWLAFTICAVELAERFSYYGTTQVMINFIQQPLPLGSKTGSVTPGNDQPGALNKGQAAATAISQYNMFWSYFMPIVGAYMADTYWGRKKTIMISILITIVGRVFIVVSSIPGVINKPDAALGLFVVGLTIMGIGTGGFKSNISPLVAEQYDEPFHVVTLETGEKVIVDPYLTVSRIYMYFYLMINIGSVAGQVSMVFAEKKVGFWLSYSLPTILFLLCPLIMIIFGHRYKEAKPTGSVLPNSLRVISICLKKSWSFNPVRLWKNVHADDFWNAAKPSLWKGPKPNWMTFDDVWVDEIRRGVKASNTFWWLPLFWLSYNQILNNLTSQAATMERHGVPNDLLSNLDPIAIIILIPFVDNFLYPALRRMGIRLSAIRKLGSGYFFAAAGMVWAAVVQHNIYAKQPPATFIRDRNNVLQKVQPPAPINVWAQSGSYILVAAAEILTSITSLEYAFTKAPVNMRSLVQSLSLFMNAISAVLGFAFTALNKDPLLVWNYGTMAVLAFIGGTTFFLSFRKQDRMEDELNKISEISQSTTMKKAVNNNDVVNEKTSP